jgi:hypothetical protein
MINLQIMRRGPPKYRERGLEKAGHPQPAVTSKAHPKRMKIPGVVLNDSLSTGVGRVDVLECIG